LTFAVPETALIHLLKLLGKGLQILETYATLTRYTKIRARLVRASLRRNFRMRLLRCRGCGMLQPRHGPLVYFRYHTLPKSSASKTAAAALALPLQGFGKLRCRPNAP